MTTFELFKAQERKITEKQSAVANMILSGQVGSFDEYKLQIGQLRGLNTAMDLIRESFSAEDGDDV